MSTAMLNQLERNFMVSKLANISPTKPFNQVRREFYISQTGGDKKLSLANLEKLWLMKFITDNGGTPTEGARKSTLWKEALVSIGLLPGVYLNQNKLDFYLGAD